ncbi:hypothetical protein F5X98DRAFT_328012 [Xylaria grammica]|nr:hypothetical protein F5X98DRAFT_328012 [Xylaria grammica]
MLLLLISPIFFSSSNPKVLAPKQTPKKATISNTDASLACENPKAKKEHHGILVYLDSARASATPFSALSTEDD